MPFTSQKISTGELRKAIHNRRTTIASVARKSQIPAGTISNWFARGDVVGVDSDYLAAVAAVLEIPVATLIVEDPVEKTGKRYATRNAAGATPNVASEAWLHIDWLKRKKLITGTEAEKIGRRAAHRMNPARKTDKG